VQWAPSWAVVQTFVSVFPHVVLLRPANVLIGSDQPIPDARERLLQRLADPAIAAELARGNPERVAEVAAEVAGDPFIWGPDTARLPAALTDMFPRDEFFLNNPVLDTWGTEPPGELGPRAQDLVARMR
jgi:hypothetical protein